MGLTKPRAAQIFNLDYKQSTRVVTTTNITLTGGAPSSVDGVSLTTGDRVLVTGQSTGSQNGLYYITTLGSGSSGTWARTSDGNENGEIEAGMIVMVTEGVIYADTQWKLITDDPITINTTALTFTQNYMANSISSGTSNVVVTSNANVTISSAGTANVLTVRSTGTVTAGTASVTGNVIGGNLVTTGQANVGTLTVNGGSTFTGNLLPSANVTYNLGSPTQRWKEIFLAANTIDIGGALISADLATGSLILTGPDGAEFILSGTSPTTSVGQFGMIEVSNAMSSHNTTTGALTVVGGAGIGGNINVGGVANITGNVSGGNLLTSGLISATSTITSAANITGGNIVATTAITNGNITITGANIVSTGPTLRIDPNGSGGTDGNVIIAGNLSVQGNVTYINSNNVTTNDLTINVANNASTAAQANGGGIGVGPAGSEYISLTYNSTSNIWVASNGLTSQGILSATGNVTGSNIIAGAQVVATGNISGSNVVTAGQVSATGNVVGSTLIASGNIAVQSRQQVKFYDTDSSNFISLRAPNALTGDYLLTLPTSYGNADQVLSTNGAGILAWADQTGGNGGGSATSYPNSTVSPVPGSTGNFDLTFNFVQTSQEIPFESSATDAFGVNLGEVYSMMDPGGEVLEPVDLGVLT
jgi:hypothetical protein